MTTAEYSILNENVSSSTIESLDDAPGPGDVPDGGIIAWLQVAGAFGINLSTWGVINIYGVYQTHYQSHQLKDHSEASIALIGSLQSGLLLLVCTFAGPVYDAGYCKSLIYVGSACILTGMMITSICSQYWQLLLAQGLAVGIGGGLLYLPGMGIIQQYFKKKSAFAFGVASLGSCIGGIIFPVVFRQVQVRMGFGWATRAIGFIQLATLLVPIFLMKPRTVSTTFRRLLDIRIFNDGPFLVFSLGMLLGYMGVYITNCYIQLYALSICHTPAHIASYFLTFTNIGSLFGRLVPNFLADTYAGAMNTHIAFSMVAAVLAFCWIGIKNTTGLVVFSVLDGFFSGTFVSLGAPIVFSLSDDSDTIGTRLGMLTGACGLGLLIGSPIAGTMLDHGSWVGLQSWAGSLSLAATIFIFWARIARFGTKIKIKV